MMRFPGFGCRHGAMAYPESTYLNSGKNSHEIHSTVCWDRIGQNSLFLCASNVNFQKALGNADTRKLTCRAWQTWLFMCCQVYCYTAKVAGIIFGF
jgi:hypothetical protein